MTTRRSLVDKIWDAHVIRDFGNAWALLHIDRHLLHDLSGPSALAELSERGLKVRNPELVFATPDHAVSSDPQRTGETFERGAKLYRQLLRKTREENIQLFDIGEVGQGIVHVMGPELGIVVPGITVVCGDSHTCTNGGMGALAFGIGSSEITHALATQTLRQKRPKQMRIRIDGPLGHGVTPKDLALHLIGRLGAAAGVGYAIEYTGSTIRAMPIEGRLTLCNLTVELGAKSGIVAPDDTTFEYLSGKPFAPKGALFDDAVEAWRALVTDADAVFDLETVVEAALVVPTITWGTSPEHAIAVDDTVPDPATVTQPEKREALQAAIAYMGVVPGRPIAGLPINWVFIGSCANARLSDLRDAAKIAKGRRVAAGVTAWVVPGSEAVKRQAEAEGLDRVFLDCGFQWRQPGCSMCVAVNGEVVPPGARCISTSNRNFVGRQGPGARTHLASPAMAVAAAVTGQITDVRSL